MGALSAPIDCCFELKAIMRAANEMPLHLVAARHRFAQVAENIFFSFMPKHSFAEYQAKGHLVDKSLESARRTTSAQEIGVHPAPEVTVAIPAIVSLDSKSKGIALKNSSIKHDLT